jgi:hypothetical protein
MKMRQGGGYDPETVTLLRAALDTAWANLTPGQQTSTSKSDLAERILLLAAKGERDPIRLRTRAVLEVVPAKQSAP